MHAKTTRHVKDAPNYAEKLSGYILNLYRLRGALGILERFPANTFGIHHLRLTRTEISLVDLVGVRL